VTFSEACEKIERSDETSGPAPSLVRLPDMVVVEKESPVLIASANLL
jgi:hypothetical protein